MTRREFVDRFKYEPEPANKQVSKRNYPWKVTRVNGRPMSWKKHLRMERIRFLEQGVWAEIRRVTPETAVIQIALFVDELAQ